jgi:hypothetical protein
LKDYKVWYQLAERFVKDVGHDQCQEHIYEYYNPETGERPPRQLIWLVCGTHIDLAIQNPKKTDELQSIDDLRRLKKAHPDQERNRTYKITGGS